MLELGLAQTFFSSRLSKPSSLCLSLCSSFPVFWASLLPFSSACPHVFCVPWAKLNRMFQAWLEKSWLWQSLLVMSLLMSPSTQMDFFAAAAHCSLMLSLLFMRILRSLSLWGWAHNSSSPACSQAVCVGLQTPEVVGLLVSSWEAAKERLLLLWLAWLVPSWLPWCV